MGGAVSSGNSNEELVDNLCHEDYITRPEVEKVFRKVDRADYMTFQEEDDKLEAYEDRAWRRGTLHMSAPCIYTKAMEALKLERGLSFLNIGSGTGYLSTMAGLILGPSGINHGVEIYPENVEYAQEKLAQFKSLCEWYDPLIFCEPVFLVGNGLLISPGNMQYDRVYCGAACPPEHIQLMKNMLKLGGILVLPHDNKLESIQRVAELEWTTEVILPSVSFAPLITPTDEELKHLSPVEFKLQPHMLKQLCRLSVLSQLQRARYDHIDLLPLPKHLKDYVAHYQEWKAPPPSMKLLCDGTQSERDTGRKRQREEGGASNKPPPTANAVSINGKRVFFCSFNGVIFQIPIDSDASGEEDDGESGKEVGEEARDEKEVEHFSDSEEGDTTQHEHGPSTNNPGMEMNHSENGCYGDDQSDSSITSSHDNSVDPSNHF